jgi:hypothetical protein
MIKLLEKYIETGVVENFQQTSANYRFSDEGDQVSVIVPGHFYTFAQLNPKGNDLLPSLDDWTTGTVNVKPYFDNAPIFLALDQYGLGLNIKLIPQSARRRFIRQYFKVILPVLSNLLNEDGSLIQFEKRIRQPEIGPFLSIGRGGVKNTFLNQLSDRKFDFLVDKYKRDEMRFLTLIDWPHVPKIGEVNYSADPAIATRSSISNYLNT